ncbi:hypothetical protein EJB05_12593, partial [Eragrostis curvula]
MVEMGREFCSLSLRKKGIGSPLVYFLLLFFTIERPCSVLKWPPLRGLLGIFGSLRARVGRQSNEQAVLWRPNNIRDDRNIFVECLVLAKPCCCIRWRYYGELWTQQSDSGVPAGGFLM